MHLYVYPIYEGITKEGFHFMHVYCNRDETLTHICVCVDLEYGCMSAGGSLLFSGLCSVSPSGKKKVYIYIYILNIYYL